MPDAELEIIEVESNRTVTVRRQFRLAGAPTKVITKPYAPTIELEPVELIVTWIDGEWSSVALTGPRVLSDGRRGTRQMMSLSPWDRERLPDWLRDFLAREGPYGKRCYKCDSSAGEVVDRSDSPAISPDKRYRHAYGACPNGAGSSGDE